MITTLLMIAGILYLSLQLEDKLKIPSPLGLIVLSFTTHYGFQQVPVLTGDAEHFAALVVFLLPPSSCYLPWCWPPIRFPLSAFSQNSSCRTG